MNKTLALLAAAATFVVANTQMAPVAQAGGGVRLQFGFPLGSFVARPCASCGSSSHSYRANNYAAERRAAARRAAIAEAKAERAAAARRAAIADAKAERAAAARRAAIAEAQAEKAAARRAAALAEARRKAQIAKRQADEKKEIEKAELTTDAPDKAPLPVRAQTQEGEVAVGEPKVILSNGKSSQEEKVAVAPVVTPEPKTVETATKPTDCKKFVPSAGLTITVPCQ